ncbi:MAG: TM0996/MTH895 family glutaredoxin-like protein [Peptococcaceae bacterium]|nr:TM0996/MTH895 family glutaredoxin-like protein [Peptococcaceae bacterium]
MDIKILGPGCRKCKALEKEVREVVSEMGIEANIEKVTDVNEITSYNVFMTPGLVVNGKVLVSGRVPKRDEIKKWLQEEA